MNVLSCVCTYVCIPVFVDDSVSVIQGLRTLELCVDNLQPDFLYEHIQPVRAELMQVSVVEGEWCGG